MARLHDSLHDTWVRLDDALSDARDLSVLGDALPVSLGSALGATLTVKITLGEALGLVQL